GRRRAGGGAVQLPAAPLAQHRPVRGRGAQRGAKNIVAAGLADRAEVQVAYAIGKAHPVGVFVETFGTEKVEISKIQEAVVKVFDLRPAAIIRDLDLLRPIYSGTSAYGHFGREGFSWESTDRADSLRAAAGL
ncbi:methionine adenosyltransferase domain-containing protein, partial [Streptosporangium sp. NPDC001682]